MKNASYLSMTWLMLWFVASMTPQGQVARADFVFGEPTKVPNINSASFDHLSSITADGLEIYLHSLRPHGPSGGQGDIWVSKRSTTNEPWSEPVMLGPPINSNGPNFDPIISADGLELYLTDGLPSFYGYAPNPEGYGGGDLWVSRRTNRHESWSEPENLGPVVNTASVEHQPSISRDGLSLYFVSERPGGMGNGDLYVTSRTSKADPWGPPESLGPILNDWAWQATPFISPDNLSLFYSSGTSSPDIWVSTRASTEDAWGEPINFAPVNQIGAVYGSVFSQGGSTIYFSRANGALAISTYDIWQVEVTTTMDLNGDGVVDTLDINELERHLGDTDNSLYDIAPFPLGDGVADAKDLRALREYLQADPHPIDGANEIPHDVVLSWESIESAQAYDVYIGTDYYAVKDATTTDASYMGRPETSSYDPGRLDFAKTYYWRVDEVKGEPDFSVSRGGVWRFTTEAFSYPIANITAEASSTFGISLPEHTINGSGLEDDLHGTSPGDMWISAGIPATIEYAFDRAYKLHELWLWNSNQLIESFVGFGAKDVAVEHSLDGKNWTVLDGIGPLAQAPGTEGYAHNNTVDLGGAAAQHVRLTINSVHGIVPQASLSEVRFFYIPTHAREPQPTSGSAEVDPSRLLSWRAGREAVSHDVYLGTDTTDLPLVGSVTQSSFDPGSLDLQLSQTYHWRVDEVNEAVDPSTWMGDAWSFTTVDAISVDDMERYADAEFFEIWATWVDGFDDPANGGIVGNGATGTPETGIVHGGGQSMPLYFDNSTASVSEATRTLDQTQDWTRSGIQTLALYFRRGADNTGGEVYLKINDTKVVYHEDPATLPPAGDGWTQWNIDLAALGTDLTRVRSLTVGIEGAGSKGVLYLDDIALYRNAVVVSAAEG